LGLLPPFADPKIATVVDDIGAVIIISGTGVPSWCIGTGKGTSAGSYEIPHIITTERTSAHNGTISAEQVIAENDTRSSWIIGV